MKSFSAIVTSAAIDINLLAEQCIVGYADLLGIEKRITRTRAQLDDQVAAAKTRRLQLGQWLAQVRDRWPERGPNAKPWGEFLERVKIPDSTARMYIAEFRDPTGFAERRAGSAKTPSDDQPAEPDDDQTGATTPGIIPLGDKPPFRQLTADELIARRREDNEALARLPAKERKRVLQADKVNLQGGSGEAERGTWCTPKAWAAAVGPFEVDPFSNPNSHVRAVIRCMRENDGDGFGDGSRPGVYRVGARKPNTFLGDAGAPAVLGHATELTSVWIQPPYEVGFVERVIAHYGHTRFVALLRLSPDPAWFRRLWPLVATIAIPVERIAFEPPPNVPPPESTISYPHALYYACAADVTDAIRERCIVLEVDHGRCDPASLRQAMRLVE